MDNEPQGQTGKRVIDSFSFKIADMTIVDRDYGSLRFLYSAYKLANKNKSQQTKRANQFNIQHSFERTGRKTRCTRSTEY